MKLTVFLLASIVSIAPRECEAWLDSYINSCSGQSKCIDFSIQDVSGVPSGCDDGKTYKKVCATLNYSQPSCDGIRVHDIAYGCVASEENGQQCSVQDDFALFQFSAFERTYRLQDGFKQCQIIEAGKSAHFLFMAESYCGAPYSDPLSGMNCSPNYKYQAKSCYPWGIVSEYECLWEIPVPVGNGGGEPHFQTFDGTRYDYHGSCDLVMARSPSFGDVGLDLHIRTQKMGTWSLISNAALRIGDDVLEFENDGSHYINGRSIGLPYEMASKYIVTKERTIIEREDETGKVRTLDKTVATVDLGGGRYIHFTRLGKGLMFVKVDGFLHETEGMLGIHGIKGMVGRDRQTILSDPNEMGAQWQVRDTEPMLFRKSRAPQYPDLCIPPDGEATPRRLRMSTAQTKLAIKTCEPVADELRSMCVDDVLLSGDVASADPYLFGEAF